MNNLDRYIESLIFAADKSISLEEIKYVLDSAFEVATSYDEIIEIIEKIKNKFDKEEYSFGVVEISNGYTFLTKGSYHNIVGEYLKALTNKRLSKASIETLAIIAYKQPVTKPEIEQIRGVNCDYTTQKLLEKGLIEIQGRDDGPGRALIYTTSVKFMDYFGLKSMKDLPKTNDFEISDNIVGSSEEE